MFVAALSLFLYNPTDRVMQIWFNDKLRFCLFPYITRARSRDEKRIIFPDIAATNRFYRRVFARISRRVYKSKVLRFLATRLVGRGWKKIYFCVKLIPDAKKSVGWDISFELNDIFSFND